MGQKLLLKACNRRIGRIGFLFAAEALKFSQSGEVERVRSPAVLLSQGGKADSQPRVQPFGVINAVLESVASGNWMAEYTGDELFPHGHW